MLLTDKANLTIFLHIGKSFFSHDSPAPASFLFFIFMSSNSAKKKNAVNSMSLWLDIIRIVFLRAHGLRRSRGQPRSQGLFPGLNEVEPRFIYTRKIN